MKTKSYAVFVAVCVLAGVALGVGSQLVSLSVQTATQTVPSPSTFSPTRPGSSTLGNALDLSEVDGFRVTVCAYEDGGFLGGSGNLRAYLLDERTGLVWRNPSIDLAVTTTTNRCQVFPDQEVKVPYGQVMYVTDTLILKDAGTLLVDGGTGAFSIIQSGWRK